MMLRKGVSYIYMGMPAAPFDSTRRGRQDEPGGRSAEIKSPSFWKKMMRFGQL